MLKTDNLVQWQLVDEQANAVFPWFTHPCLEYLKTLDFNGKRVLEFGAGRSTRWWRTKADWVTSIDTNAEWVERVKEDCEEGGLTNGIIIPKVINEGDQLRAEEYISAGDEYAPYDVVIVDGILRYECILKALEMPRPLTLIVDNFMQDWIFMCPAAVEALKGYEGRYFIQEDHTDNEGNKWQTAVWSIK